MLRELHDPDAVDIGLALAATFRRLDLRAEEAAHLRLMVEDSPSDRAVLEQLGDVELALEERPSAADHFRAAARAFMEDGAVERACDLYAKVLEATPEDMKTLQMLEELRSGVYHERRQKRRAMVALVLTALVGGLLTVYALYNLVAVRTYLEIRNVNLIYVGTGNHHAADSSVREFAVRHPWSLPLLDTERYRATLAELAPPPPPPPAIPEPDTAAVDEPPGGHTQPSVVE
jgi:hypothetical protein